MKNTTISIRKGKGHLAHNNRTMSPKTDRKSWRDELSDNNVVFVDRQIEDVYHELFDDSLKKYNKSQIEKGHAERQIKNYFDKIKRSKQEHLSYEFIFEFGNSKDFDRNSIDNANFKNLLSSYAGEFEKRHPNFKVVQMILHDDEPDSLAHLHIHFIPFSTNNKRGLEVRNSFRGAMKEMGFSKNCDFREWRERELENLKFYLNRYNFIYDDTYSFVAGDQRQEHYNTPKYKEYTSKLEELHEQKEEIAQECINLKIDKCRIEDKIEHKNKKLVDQDQLIKTKTSQIERLEEENNALITQNTVLVIENSKLKDEISQNKAILDDLEDNEVIQLKHELTTLKRQNNAFRELLKEVVNKLQHYFDMSIDSPIIEFISNSIKRIDNNEVEQRRNRRNRRHSRSI